MLVLPVSPNGRCLGTLEFPLCPHIDPASRKTQIWGEKVGALAGYDGSYVMGKLLFQTMQTNMMLFSVTVLKFGRMSSDLLAYGASDGTLTVCSVSKPPSIVKELRGHSKDVTDHLRDVFVKQMGLSDQDIVVLSCGHTLGEDAFFADYAKAHLKRSELG
ncbi:hypothetical protein IFM89_011021 [Coptis chinensis]|uniref:Plant heme peroxidase family profile domain-containing protein n=1 Tax=Coptis chinensis TaxID=261450 RepID=A0A835IM63_9MAGN|nr:hypothetical protein IFM89_011021 [Coptis chinensis]